MEPPREGLADRIGLAPGQSVGTCVLVRLERTAGDTQIWLARTTTFPQQPMTVRARAMDVMDRASPFAAEVQLGRHLSHPGLVVARETIELGPWSCAITPGAPGIPLPELHDALASLRATNESHWSEIVAHIVASLLAGLDAAHRITAPDHPKGVVHGGVRPELVLVAPDGAVRLAGFAVKVDDDPSRIVDRTGDAVAYLAPEQLGSRSRAPAMDLWSIGAVLHELVDGRRFRGDVSDPRELYRIALTGVVAAPQHAAPPTLEQVRKSLVAKNPRDRPPTAADAVALLGKPAASAKAKLGELVRARMPDDAQPPRLEAPTPLAPPDLSQVVPSFVSPFVSPMVPAEEGTVAIDPVELAAMRVSTGSGRAPEPAAPPATIAEEDAPIMRRRAGAATPTPVPPAPRAAATPPPTLHLPPPLPLDPPPSAPAAPIRDAAPPPRAPPTRIDFDPRAEGTSMTVREERRAKRSFVAIIAVAGVLAIVVGVVAGVMIAGDDSEDAKAPATVPDAKRKAEPEPPPSGPVLHPRAP